MSPRVTVRYQGVMPTMPKPKPGECSVTIAPSVPPEMVGWFAVAAFGGRVTTKPVLDPQAQVRSAPR